MSRLDIEQLHSFMTIATCGSIAAATQILHRSPSALSEQLQKLEIACHAVLMTRSKRGMCLTHAGETLLPLAAELIELNNQAIAKMRGYALRGHLQVAITDYFLPHSIAPLLRQINKTHPELRLEVSVLNSMQIIETLGQKKFDISIYFRLSDTTYTALPEETMLRSEAVHWVAQREFEYATLEPLPLLTLPPECQLQARAIALLTSSNIAYLPVHSASSVAGLLSAVQAGLGVACLNASAITDDMRKLNVNAGLPALPNMQLCLHSGAANKTGAAELSSTIESFCLPL